MAPCSLGIWECRGSPAPSAICGARGIEGGLHGREGCTQTSPKLIKRAALITGCPQWEEGW